MPTHARAAPFSHPGWQIWPGLLLGTGLLLLVALGLLSILQEAGELDPGRTLASSYFQSVVQFTLWQAFLSVLLSLALALPVATALARYTLGVFVKRTH